MKTCLVFKIFWTNSFQIAWGFDEKKNFAVHFNYSSEEAASYPCLYLLICFSFIIAAKHNKIQANNKTTTTTTTKNDCENAWNAFVEPLNCFSSTYCNNQEMPYLICCFVVHVLWVFVSVLWALQTRI